jgi:hypothetical protein
VWLVLLVSSGVFAAYLLLHYVLFLLASHPKDAAVIGHELNQFERRQLIEWQPKKEDFLKHDDEHRTYDDVFGPYRSETDNYSTCVFPRLPFTHRHASDYLLLKLKDGMRLLDLGCGSGAAAEYFGRRRSVDITCVTNSSIQGEICRGKFQKFDGRLRVVVADFDDLSLPDASFDAIYAFESILSSLSIHRLVVCGLECPAVACASRKLPPTNEAYCLIVVTAGVHCLNPNPFAIC